MPYDAAANSWVQWNNQGSPPYVPAVVNGYGWTGYIFGDGDATYTYYAVTVPHTVQHVMLEIGFVSDDPTIDLQQPRALEHAFLATLRL